MEKVFNMLEILLSNWQDAVIGGTIVTCSVIFLMGILKKFIFGKIRNKLIRKVVLAFVSVCMVFPITAIYFVSYHISFEVYWWACLGMAILTILTYWLYENTGLRNLISLIGEATVGKWATVIYYAFMTKAENKEVKNQLTKATDELKADVRKEIHSIVKEDKDLKGL